MKFILSSLKLLKAVQSLSGVINSNNTLPILDDFLFNISENELRITASDLETTMVVSIQPDLVEGAGEVTIPARLLIDILKNFPDIPVSFNIDEATLAIEITTGEGRYKMAGHKSDEFPQVPVLQDASQWEIPADVLACGFEKTIFATGNDEIRPVMTGVFMEMTNEGLNFVATDAHKLVRYRRLDIKSETLASFIVPKKPINQLKNTLSGKADEPVIVEFNKTNASFTMSGLKLVCRLIDGKYPNYNAVIPQSNPNKLTIDRQLLLSAIRRVAIFSSKATHQIRFKITGQELTLTAEDLDYYNEAKERLSCNYQGDDMEIGFNSRFFQEMLGNLNQTEVMLEMSAPNRAGLIIPVDNQNADEDILMLLMPVMLN
ncbi:MAG: DNA polymerase III subunit beta [Lentimicrobiaceae bacterium]|nr:DNA polymerase III subunit beta [Lentimicrobiaceae bacterium]MBQ4548678.1 DNA polymerase III subunit beta [Bacteroidales bacterium]MBR2052355.1 DNA polymerase III subunit beta [Bacteroidales bacterium]